jgi:putative secretion ATPase (PEP-CTERM system associated)
MYESYYGLNAAPFRLSPDPHFFFPSGIHQRALAYLQYGLNQGEGFVVVAGEAGTGKSLLAQTLISQLDTRRLIVGQLVTTQLEASDLLRMVAATFKLPSEGVAKATLLNDLGAFLTARAHEGRRVLLVVDEAQNLPAFTLEELRMLSNFQVRNQSLLQTFLLGQERFLDTLRAPGMEQFRQRVIATCKLKPLSEKETREYVDFRLRRVGWEDEPLFTDTACCIVHRATGGLPRKINLLCDRTLLSGSLDGHRRITREVVHTVLEELQEEMFPINGNLDFSDVPPEPTPPDTDPPGPKTPPPGPGGGPKGDDASPPAPDTPGRKAAPTQPEADPSPPAAPRPPPAETGQARAPTPAVPPAHRESQWRPTAPKDSGAAPPGRSAARHRIRNGSSRPPSPSPVRKTPHRAPKLSLERDEIEAHRMRAGRRNDARHRSAATAKSPPGATRSRRGRLAAFALTIGALGTAVFAAHQYILHSRPEVAAGIEAVPPATDQAPINRSRPIERKTDTGTGHIPIRSAPSHPAKSRAAGNATLIAGRADTAARLGP